MNKKTTTAIVLISLPIAYVTFTSVFILKFLYRQYRYYPNTPRSVINRVTILFLQHIMSGDNVPASLRKDDWDVEFAHFSLTYNVY